MKALFQCTQAHWFEQVNFPQWNGLTIVSIDGVAYRTPDSNANDGAFKILQNTQYARVRMVCQMELAATLLPLVLLIITEYMPKILA